jgi:hypothetical protein
VDREEACAWALVMVHFWNTDAVIRCEFDSVVDFGDWCLEEAEHLIRSAEEKWRQ